MKLSILILVIGVSIWYFCLKAKPDMGQVVDMNDIGIYTKDTDLSDDDKKSGKSKKGVNSSTTAQERGEAPSKTKGQDMTEMAEYRHMSLKKEYDQKRPFALSEERQIFTKEAFARAFAIMTKHVWLKFHITQRQLIETRYSLYQERKMKDYDRNISQ